MKKNIYRFSFVLTFFLLTVNVSFAQWVQLNPTNPVGASRATTFVIGDTAYFGNGDASGYSSAFNGYTAESNTWYSVLPCPSGGGDMGFEFTIGDTAYVGDGINPAYHNDLWAYTPASGWIARATPPGGGRGFSAGFSIGDKGYFGTGLINNATAANDFYQYDPPTNIFTTLSSIPVGRFGGVAFSANGKGYMGLGYKDNISDTVLRDMYQYNPATNTWTEMAPLPAGFGEAEPAYFVQCNKLIITLGQTIHSIDKATSQTWMFDPSDGPIGKWYRLPDCPAYPAYSPQGFTLRDTGYIVGGLDTTNQSVVKQMVRYVPNINPATVTPNISISQGSGVTLTADGGGAFKWSPSSTLSDSVTYSSAASGALTQVTASPTITTTYTITEAVCGQQATVVVKVINGVFANYVYTAVGEQVSFNSDSSQGSISHYHWDFGDGDTSDIENPVHVYKKDTSYRVCLTVADTAGYDDGFCNVVIVKAVPHCSAAFKLYADTLTPHHWYALNQSTGKLPITYAWQWGDGNTGAGDTASHVYAAAGYYTICLTISDDTACTSMYCDSSVYLYRMDGSNTMVTVNVVNSIISGIPPVNLSASQNNPLVFPNPCNTCRLKGIDNANDLFATDILGIKINLSFTKTTGGYEINFPGKLTGMFLLHDIKTGQVVKFVKE